MRIGTVITASVATVALGGMLYAFTSNASPYVDVDQALRSSDDRLHLWGSIVPGSIRNDFKRNVVTFMLKDEKGKTMTVVHNGERPANLAQAPKVAAVGGVKNGEFHSSKLIVKCPSKYEAEDGKSPAQPGA